MIALNRDRAPEAVHQNFKGPKRVALNLALLKKKRDGELEAESKDKWDSSLWKEARAQLLIETHNKCAYCETPTRIVAYGDVEHFRPKSKYWWLAYSYENYLVSCTVCNQEYKKDFFAILPGNEPLKGPSVRNNHTDAKLEELAPFITVDPVNNNEGLLLEDFLEEINSEYALIINPYYEDPADYLAYLPILENKEVVVVPAHPDHLPVVKACEDLFGINRKELLDLRFQWYCMYMTFRHTLQDRNISNATRTMNQNMLNSMTQDSSPYAGMIRYFETSSLTDLPWNFNII